MQLSYNHLRLETLRRAVRRLGIVGALCCLAAFATSALARPAVPGAQAAIPSPILSEATPGSRLLPAGTTTISFTVTTAQAAEVRAYLSNKPFGDMQYKLSSADGTTHTLSIPAEAGKPYQFFIKAAPKGNPGQPWDMTQRANYRVATPYNPPFPRIFTLWWPQWGKWEEVTPEKLARLDMWIHNLHHPYDPEWPQLIPLETYQKARQLNPNLKLFVQQFSLYGCDISNCDAIEAADKDVNGPLYRKIFVRDINDKTLEYAPGEKIYNLTNPATLDFLVQQNLTLWKQNLLAYDGIFMDSTWRNLSGLALDENNSIDTSKLDLDLDGKADDIATRDRTYELAVQDFLRKLRAGMPNAIITANAVGGEPDKTREGQPLTDRDGKPFSYTSVLDGHEFETEIWALRENSYWKTFDDFMREYAAWNTKAPFSMTPSKLPDGDTKPDDAYKSYKDMRFGLAVTLMGDATYLHNGWGFYSWFDEYDANLGQPKTGFGAPIAPNSPVWRRDFSGGVALVNSSPTQTITVELGGQFKAIKGTQDPQVNDGATVTKVTIPPLDGRILLTLTPPTSPPPTGGSARTFVPLVGK